MGIRRATIKDIDAIFDIARVSHMSPPYTYIIPSVLQEEYRHAYEPTIENRTKHADKIRRYITEDPRSVYVYETANRLVVGYSMVRKTGDTLYLKSLFVHPSYQGKGIGTELFSQQLTEQEPGMRAVLKVLKDNRVARRLYSKNGFIETDEPVERFYGAEQVVMVRSYG